MAGLYARRVSRLEPREEYALPASHRRRGRLGSSGARGALEPGWRNGRRSGLKPRGWQHREGSIPSPGTSSKHRRFWFQSDPFGTAQVLTVAAGGTTPAPAATGNAGLFGTTGTSMALIVVLGVFAATMVAGARTATRRN